MTVLGCRAGVERASGGHTSGGHTREALEPAAGAAAEPQSERSAELTPERASEHAAQHASPPALAPSTPREVVQTHVIRVEPRGPAATCNSDTNVVATLAETIAQVERAGVKVGPVGPKRVASTNP